MIFNLIGPPAIGKTTIAMCAATAIPSIRWMDIARYRACCQTEDEAWARLGQGIKSSAIVLLESNGISWRLNKILKKLDRKVITIKLTATQKLLYDGLVKRHTSLGIQDEKYIIDEFSTIDYTLKELCIHDDDADTYTFHLINDEDLYRVPGEVIKIIRGELK